MTPTNKTTAVEEWENEVDDKFSLYPTIGGITHEMLAEDLKSFITSLITLREERAREEVVNYIERNGYEIKDLQVRDNKLNVILDKLPEGQSVILVSDKVLAESRSRSSGDNK